MNKPLSILFLLFAFNAAIFGQAPESRSAKITDGQLPKVAVQTSDSLRIEQYRTPAVSLPAISPNFQLKDSLQANTPDFSRPLFTRLPFFISNEFSVSLGRRTQSDFKYANVTSIGTSFLIQPTDRLSFNITPIISHYLFGSKQYSPFTDVSCYVSGKYDVSDWMAVTAYGQVNATSGNKQLYGSPLFVPQSAYGVGMLFKVSNSVKFEVSVNNARYNGLWNQGSNRIPADY